MFDLENKNSSTPKFLKVAHLILDVETTVLSLVETICTYIHLFITISIELLSKYLNIWYGNFKKINIRLLLNLDNHSLFHQHVLFIFKSQVHIAIALVKNRSICSDLVSQSLCPSKYPLNIQNQLLHST